jgi:hypothetical protein
MELTEKEIERIRMAQKSMARERYFGPLIFALFLVFLFLYLFRYVSERELLYFSWPAIFFILFWPQLRGNPRYDELVELLVKTLEEEPDPIIDALTRKP